MDLEKQYSKVSDKAKIKKYGQYFTPHAIADFMVKWALETGAKNFLDPAVGNGIFFHQAYRHDKCLNLQGYEIDSEIIDYFESDKRGQIEVNDFLLATWQTKYDAIVCNPPYNRFQSIDNREEVQKNFIEQLGKKPSGYTNQYVLFLIKCISQMSANGRLAFIIPSEFLNSDSGSEVKDIMVSQKLLRTIINFDSNLSLFDKAITTSCIVLLDKEPKDSASFINIHSEIELNTLIDRGLEKTHSHLVSYEKLASTAKWRPLMTQIEATDSENIVAFSQFAKATRGIATGDNSYFFLSKEDVCRYHLSNNDYDEIIYKSPDIKAPFFQRKDYDILARSGKKVYVFNPNDKSISDGAREYIKKGEAFKVNKKYLCAHRKVWYQQESKPIYPIWISPASRNGARVVRNLAGVKNSTTFHGVSMNKGYEYLEDAFFLYLLTPIGQDLLMANRKEMGNGLIKFQPGDINKSKVIDFDKINDLDKLEITRITRNSQPTNVRETIDKINSIFLKYID